jgi:hypothetical protein
MSYGPNLPDLFRRAGERGAKPGDIPIEQPTKFDLVINLTTAKALGLTIPESFLTRADEVIEWANPCMSFFAAVHESACGRFCCKSLFALVIKNSPGYNTARFVVQYDDIEQVVIRRRWKGITQFEVIVDEARGGIGAYPDPV